MRLSSIRTQRREYVSLCPVAIIPSRVGDSEIQTVNARDLHEFLEVQTPFDKWIQRRIEDFGFIKGQDFSSLLSESTGGRPATDYHISLSMAKELCMTERNDKGFKARKYFIEREKRNHLRYRVRIRSHCKRSGCVIFR